MSSFTEALPGFWVSERPLWFGGVRIRSRTTVVRLADGRLWVHSASEPTPETCAALDRLGEVAWIVVPNRWHHLHATATKARYPAAKVVAPALAKERNPGLVVDVALDPRESASLAPGIEPVALRGVPFLDETLFFHRESGTLVGADVMMCGCAKDHFTWRWVSRVLGQYGRHKAPPDVRWNTKASAELTEALGALGRLPVKTILVAHADPIVDQPLQQLAAAWS